MPIATLASLPLWRQAQHATSEKPPTMSTTSRVDNLTVAHHVGRLVGRVVRLPRAAVLAHRRRRALERVHSRARGNTVEEVLVEKLGRLVHVGGHDLAHDTHESRVHRLRSGVGGG